MDRDATKALQEWGKELLREFPKGLPEEPDFKNDGTARLDWFSRGYSVGVKWAVEVGLGGKVYLGDTYENPEALDDAAKIAFAKKAFELGRLYRDIAKIEAEKEETQQAEERKAIAVIDEQVGVLRSEIASMHSREQLRIRIADLKEKSAAARASGQSIDDYGFSRKITALQDRLISIEAQESRQATSGWWLTAVGTAAGIIGLILGYYFGASAQG